MMEFFSKDPAKQLVEVKEKLTQRLVSRRIQVNNTRKLNEYDGVGSVELEVWRMENEIQFLEELLDQMERS